MVLNPILAFPNHDRISGNGALMMNSTWSWKGNLIVQSTVQCLSSPHLKVKIFRQRPQLVNAFRIFRISTSAH